MSAHWCLSPSYYDTVHACTNQTDSGQACDGEPNQLADRKTKKTIAPTISTTAQVRVSCIGVIIHVVVVFVTATILASYTRVVKIIFGSLAGSRRAVGISIWPFELDGRRGTACGVVALAVHETSSGECLVAYIVLTRSKNNGM